MHADTEVLPIDYLLHLCDIGNLGTEILYMLLICSKMGYSSYIVFCGCQAWNIILRKVMTGKAALPVKRLGLIKSFECRLMTGAWKEEPILLQDYIFWVFWSYSLQLDSLHFLSIF